MKILFTICGRAGSKGVKNKNLLDFCGVPLVYYSLAAIWLWREQYGKTREILSDVVLNTDSRELISLVERQSLVLTDVLDREEDLGGDAVPKAAVIRDCLVRMEKGKGYPYDLVVDLDITSPLRTCEDVNQVIERKIQRSDVDVVYSVTPSRRNPYFNMVREEGGFFVKAIASAFTARQQAPTFYDMNASIYAYSQEALRHKEVNTFFNSHADAVIMRDTAVLDIDSVEDFELMQVIAAHLFARDKKLKEVYEAARGIKDSRPKGLSE